MVQAVATVTMRGQVERQVDALVQRVIWDQQSRVSDELYSLAVEFAQGLGYTSGVDNGQPTVTDMDVVRALREPVSMGVVLYDAYRRLGVEIPRAVRESVGLLDIQSGRV